MEQRSHAEKVMALAKAHGVLRPRDLDAHGISRAVLGPALSHGQAAARGRGVYVAGVTGMTENHSFAESVRHVPQRIMCLLSALRFHGLTTQLPAEVWLAIPPKARRPQATPVSIRAVRF